MAKDTAIAWTDSTFNPWIGCTKVSTGCDNCYASVSTPARSMQIVWGAGRPRHRTSAQNWKTPESWNSQHEAFRATHGRSRRVFCASLADVFDNEVPPVWRSDLFKLITDTPHLDWLLLTKRIGNVPRMIPFGWQDFGLPPNLWLGATVVNQEEYDRDVRKLLAVPASVHFVSIEPMLGAIDLGYVRDWRRNGARLVDWVIVGGESGHGARPIQRGWVESLRRQCELQGVPFFFKQWGGQTATAGGCELNGTEVKAWPTT